MESSQGQGESFIIYTIYNAIELEISCIALKLSYIFSRLFMASPTRRGRNNHVIPLCWLVWMISLRRFRGFGLPFPTRKESFFAMECNMEPLKWPRNFITTFFTHGSLDLGTLEKSKVQRGNSSFLSPVWSYSKSYYTSVQWKLCIYLICIFI